MSIDPTDPRWPRLLSLAVHELRTPITVAAGYLRMVLKERAGPVSDQQRKLLEEAEKSCGRLSALVSEMSDLAALEGGTAAIRREPFDLAALLRELVTALPELPDRTVSIILEGADSPVAMTGDAGRLKLALSALLMALRRELVTSDRLVVQLEASGPRPSITLAIGDPEQVAVVAAADPASLERFDEWRGGSGLSLAIARRVINQHGGSLHPAPGEGKAGALVLLPPG